MFQYMRKYIKLEMIPVDCELHGQILASSGEVASTIPPIEATVEDMTFEEEGSFEFDITLK